MARRATRMSGDLRGAAIGGDARGRALHFRPGECEAVASLGASECVLLQEVTLLTLNLAHRIGHRVQRCRHTIRARHLGFVVFAVEQLGVRHLAWRLLARDGRQVVLAMHPIHVHQVVTATTQFLVAVARKVACLVGILPIVVEEGRAIALRTATDREELGAAAALAEVPTKVDGHGLAFLLRNKVCVVPPLLAYIVNTTHMKIPCWSALGVDVVVPLEVIPLGVSIQALLQKTTPILLPPL
mmetsp:Transcript_93047/g.233873  ORF Transcript_93047/g.233873 Transcript_93047/m.233873 type:complete len:242 (+) Transcript_93047:6213-6938(+)